jgi:integrase
MTFGEGPGSSGFEYESDPEDPEFDFPILAGDTEKALDDLHGRARTDYETWKRGFLNWLYHEGKKPDRGQGFASGTIRKTSYHTDAIMRWLWTERGYTTELTPEDADELMKTLGRHSDYADSNLNNIVKTIKRLFSYYNHEKGRSIDWECNYSLSEPTVTNRDYFRKQEFQSLYEASLNHGAVKHYNNCTPEERDKLKAHLAQRFEKGKEDVAVLDFDRANSFKIPSLVSTTLDMGLRPIEIARATTEWVNLDKAALEIPAAESSKNSDNWECVLSNKAVRALRKWLDERASYEKYATTNALWLNKKGNPYRSQSLNYLLDKLIEGGGIEPAGRDLTWYSIRHGVATLWADEEDIQDAREQLRHEQIETTLGYSHSSTSKRRNSVNSKY